MNKNRVSSIFVLGVMLMSLFLLTAFRPEVNSRPAAGIFANHEPVVVDPADRKFSFAADHETAEEKAANLSAARWLAMGGFYEEQGMLTRDNFDYGHAANLSAARWLAMGAFYEEQGMLTRDNFDYEEAADLSAARWQAMGEFYEAQSSGINYAMDLVDLKLFNAAEASPSSAAGK